jgi:hypothetical protein
MLVDVLRVPRDQPFPRSVAAASAVRAGPPGILG